MDVDQIATQFVQSYYSTFDRDRSQLAALYVRLITACVIDNSVLNRIYHCVMISFTDAGVRTFFRRNKISGATSY